MLSNSQLLVNILKTWQNLDKARKISKMRWSKEKRIEDNWSISKITMLLNMVKSKLKLFWFIY